MIGQSWSEKSTDLSTSLKIRTEQLIESLGLPFEVKHGMSGLNDRLVITKKDNEDGELFISVIIGWFNADAEIALVHKNSNGSGIEYLTHNYIGFDNEKYKANVEKDRYEGYLCKNQVKYYSSPFTEKEEAIFEDIKTLVTKLVEEQSVENAEV